jgi:hypothetical protein
LPAEGGLTIVFPNADATNGEQRSQLMSQPSDDARLGGKVDGILDDFAAYAGRLPVEIDNPFAAEGAVSPAVYLTYASCPLPH